jgi:hypothetical protein
VMRLGVQQGVSEQDQKYFVIRPFQPPHRKRLLFDVFDMQRDCTIYISTIYHISSSVNQQPLES